MMKAFDDSEYESARTRYEAEAGERWGDTDAYREQAEKTKGYTKEKWDAAAAEMYAVFGKFAVCKASGAAADSEEAQTVAAELQTFITENYYTCTKQILAGLGQMYVCDERFRKNIDRQGDGTAAYAAEAIAVYCQR